ncbi:MAG TPA: glycosyltransferase family 4 protein [Longimicrobium sp.]|nr:glycosyltransferase family 4 protein [Longimicrobium sp.]
MSAAPELLAAPDRAPSGADALAGVRLVHVTTVASSFTFLQGQVRLLRERGVQVSLVSSPDGDLDAFAAKLGVPAHGVEMPRRITPLQDLGAVLRLRRHLRALRPDVVHAHTPKGGLLGMLGAWLAGVPVRVYHMRGLPLMGAQGVRRRLLWCTERVSCALAHRVICVSHSLRDVALREGLCPPERITVVAGGSGQGVDAGGRFDPQRLEPGTREAVRARMGIPADAVLAGFVGRLVRDKGVVELYEAWRALRERIPALHLLLVGPFESEDPVPPEVRRGFEEDPRVHLSGMDWNTPPYYAAMDLLVLPTYREGFPNVPLEAAAMGLPVVATRIPGCVDAVDDGRTGTLVPARDAAALAEAIRGYAEDPDLRRAHGQAGRARVEAQFRQEVVWEGIFAEYARLLGPRLPAGGAGAP